MARTPGFNGILSNTMAVVIDPDDHSGSESEFEPEGCTGSTNNDTVTDNNSGNSKSGALNPASAARVELTRELNAIGKGKGKGRTRPPCLHSFTGSGLQYFHSPISVRPSDRQPQQPSIIPDLLSPLALRHRGHSGSPRLLPIHHHLGRAWHSGQVSGGSPKIMGTSASAMLLERRGQPFRRKPYDNHETNHIQTMRQT